VPLCDNYVAHRLSLILKLLGMCVLLKLNFLVDIKGKGWAGGMVQVVTASLPIKCKALSSNTVQKENFPKSIYILQKINEIYILKFSKR
jgi:hypothetical protein